jgi:hypothetical protein
MSTSSADITFLAKDSDGKLQGIQGSDIGFAMVKAYTVAQLPAGIAGAVAFATNGCAFDGTTNGGNMVRQNPGAGTGCLVTHNGTAWKIAGTSVTVTA